MGVALWQTLAALIAARRRNLGVLRQVADQSAVMDMTPGGSFDNGAAAGATQACGFPGGLDGWTVEEMEISASVGMVLSWPTLSSQWFANLFSSDETPGS